MNIGTIIQLALAIFKFANWVAAKVNQAEWQKQGYNEAAAKYAAEWQRIVGYSEESYNAAVKMTREERDKILEEDI